MTIPGDLTAILNSFWQAAALAGLVWLALKWTSVNAATRHVIWWVALAVIVLLPVTPQIAIQRSRQAASTSLHGNNSVPDLQLLPAKVDEAPAILTLPEQPSEKWPLAIVALWAVVLLYRLARMLQGFRHLRGLKQSAAILDLPFPNVGRRARVLVSSDIASPMAVGFLHPAVLLPEDLSGRIGNAELDQIVLHEAAHLARLDDWSNLAARVLGALLCLHPVARWILRRIEFEREAACDDWVVARTGAVILYAESLAHMVEIRSERGGLRRAEDALASGVFGRGSRIGDRIELLLRYGREFSPRVSSMHVASVAFALCCLAAAGSLAPRWIAFAKVPTIQHPAVPVTVGPPPPPPAPLTRKQPEPQPLLVAQAAASAPKAPPALEFEVASIRPATFPSPEWAAGFMPRPRRAASA
jgi:beta-lactamase regulating signal transducer with metallopeptidase domain